MQHTYSPHASGSIHQPFTVWLIEDHAPERRTLEQQVRHILGDLGLPAERIVFVHFDTVSQPIDCLHNAARPDLLFTDLRLPYENTPADWDPKICDENRNGLALVGLASERKIRTVIVTGQSGRLNLPGFQVVTKPALYQYLAPTVLTALGSPKRLLDTDLQWSDNGDTMQIYRHLRPMLSFLGLERLLLLNAIAHPDERLRTVDLADKVNCAPSQFSRAATAINGAFAKDSLPLKLVASLGAKSDGHALITQVPVAGQQIGARHQNLGLTT